MVGALERFWAKIDTSAGPEGCWTWTDKLHGGYGRFHLGNRYGKSVRIMAHRFAYEITRGPVPIGLDLDHLCRNRACSNPSHLEPVTRRENILRGEAPPVLNGRKTHCKRGHELVGHNVIHRSDGYRECRTCARMHLRAHKARRKAERAGRVVEALTT